MIFTANGTPIEIPTPQYGYTVEYGLALVITRVAGGYRLWSNGAAYNRRTCKGLRFILDYVDAMELSEFLRTAALARTQNITLSLGASASGFFPGGPDLGDVGDFVIRPAEYKPAGMVLSPFRRFSPNLDFEIITAPAYALSTVEPEGDVSIGSVATLRYPTGGFNPIPEYSHATEFSYSGAPDSNDLGSGADVYTCKWEQDCNQSLAAALMAYLVANMAEDLPVVMPGYSFMWGPDKAAAGEYLANLISNKISVRHSAFDEFQIGMEMALKEVVA